MMGMFDGEDFFSFTSKKNENEGKSFEEFKKEIKERKVTISQDEFMKKSSQAISSGRFMRLLRNSSPEQYIMVSLALIPVMSDLAHIIFEEDKTDGRKN